MGWNSSVTAWLRAITAAAVAAVIAMAVPAWASPGCDAVNSGVLDGTATFNGPGNPTDTGMVEAINTSPFSSDRATTQAFNAGDTINFSLAIDAGLFSYLRFNSPGVTYVPRYQNPISGHYSQPLPSGVSKLYILSGRPNMAIDGSAVAAASCTPVTPTITSLSPGQGVPSGTVTITGTGFLGASSVTFGGVSASFSVVSATQISATVPAGSGTVNVTVTNSGAYNATGPGSRFTYAGSIPVITKQTGVFSSTAGGATIAFDGTGFSGAVVKVDGVVVNPAVLTDTRLELVTPAHAAGSGAITLTNAAGDADPPGSVDWLDPPTVSAAFNPAILSSPGISRLTFTFSKITGLPASLIAFGSTLPNGLNVAATPNATLGGCTGGTVYAAAGTNVILYTGGTMASGTFSCTLAVDVVATGTGTLTVTPSNATTPRMSVGGTPIPGRMGASATLSVASPITITPKTLPNATAGQTNYMQTISATGGSGALTLSLTGEIPRGMTFTPATGILTGTPNMAGRYDFTITAADTAGATAAQDYEIVISAAAPTVTGLDIRSGPVAGGTTVVISGTNFSDASSVLFGSTPARSFSVNTASRITAITPAGSGTVDVRIITPGGTSDTTAGDLFSYVTTPLSIARTWVSRSGDDAHDCTRSAPCRTFAGAFVNTLAGGEVNCVDSGDYGEVTITRAVSIVCDGGRAHVLVGDGDGIVVNAGASDAVTLSGFDIAPNPANVPLSGIKLLSAGSLTIANTRLRGFTGAANAVAIVPTTPSVVVTLDGVSIASNMATAANGVLVSPEAGSAAKVSILRSRFDGSAGAGVRFDSVGKSGVTITALIDQSFFAWSNVALLAKAPAGTGTISLTVLGSTFSRNSYAAIVNGAVTATFGNDTIANNGTGLFLLGGAVARSLGGNRLGGNVTDGVFTGRTGTK